MPDAATFPSALPDTLPTQAAHSPHLPGNKGIWVGICCEFVEFFLLFGVYFVARLHFPDAFTHGAPMLSRSAGTTITLLMITSSFFVAASVHAIRQDRRQQSLLWLTAALITALGYPVVKYDEIVWNLAHGINGESGIFFTVYYYLTFNHLVHAMWGIIGMFWVLGRHLFGGYSSDEYSGLEALASYWHATDIIWLAMFPLFYILA